MYDLLQASSGENDLARLQDYFADRKYEINVGDATIDMMVFDTAARSAFLSRGSSYGLLLASLCLRDLGPARFHPLLEPGLRSGPITIESAM
jgi:hypothetical protein